jgi:hypothetical protein
MPNGVPKFCGNRWSLIADIHIVSLVSVKYFFIFTANIQAMEFPGTLHYTKDHEWISIDGDTATDQNDG